MNGQVDGWSSCVSPQRGPAPHKVAVLQLTAAIGVAKAGGGETSGSVQRRNGIAESCTLSLKDTANAAPATLLESPKLTKAAGRKGERLSSLRANGKLDAHCQAGDELFMCYYMLMLPVGSTRRASVKVRSPV